MPHDDKANYDEASKIIGRAFPAMARANDIVGRAFPATGRASGILAGAGFVPKYGSGATAGAGYHAGEEPTAGTSGGISRTGSTGFDGTVKHRRPGAVSGPHRVPPRTPAAKLIAADVAAGTPVDINAWNARLQAAGVSEEAVFAAYDASGGDAVLSRAEATHTADDDVQFAGDFAASLEMDHGVSAEVIVGAYQEAGGRLGG